MVWLGEDVHTLNQVKRKSRHSASSCHQRKADARAVLLLLLLLLLSQSFFFLSDILLVKSLLIIIFSDKCLTIVIRIIVKFAVGIRSLVELICFVCKFYFCLH